MKSDVKHLRGNNDGNLRAHPQFYLETVPSGQVYRQLEPVLHVFQFACCWAQGLREQGARNFKVRWLSFRSPIFNVGALKRAKEPGGIYSTGKFHQFIKFSWLCHVSFMSTYVIGRFSKSLPKNGNL